jgi:hypothetical protein
MHSKSHISSSTASSTGPRRSKDGVRHHRGLRWPRDDAHSRCLVGFDQLDHERVDGHQSGPSVVSDEDSMGAQLAAFSTSITPVDNSLPVCPRLLRQITPLSQCSGEVITRGSTLPACGDAAASCGAVARMAHFRSTSNRSSAGLAPHVEHRSPTVKRMDHVHVWVYGDTDADEWGIPNSFCATDF